MVAGSLFVALLLVKPWGGPTQTPSDAIAAMPPPWASTNPTASNALLQVAVAPPVPETWPVTVADEAGGRAGDRRAPSMQSRLASHTGTWGMAALGNGPRFVLDEPWVDWAAVPPSQSRRAADRIATWPGTGICTGLPVVLDRPSIVAVTTPASVADDPPIEGWWSDGGRIASLDGSIRVLSAFGSRGVTYLERVDGSTWPPGRYAFDVGRGDEIVSLVVCLARAG